MGDIKVQRISLQCIDMKRFATKIAKKSIIQQETEKGEFRFILERGCI
jgi:hypothetical protein